MPIDQHETIATEQVHVVLCTCNGARFIGQQIASIGAQHWPLRVSVFDDCSTDGTLERLQMSAGALAIEIHRNTRRLGVVQNFESGIANVLEKGARYIALCDQDDVWDKERLSKGMQRLLAIESERDRGTPLLVHSDLRMIDAANRLLFPSYLARRGYKLTSDRSLPTILGQNGVMGNTILMNRSLAEIALPFPKYLHMHDYWLAVLVELFGYRELLLEPLVLYRIHASNVSNSLQSFTEHKLCTRESFRKLQRRDFRLPYKEDGRIHSVTTLLTSPERFPVLQPEQRKVLEQFAYYLDFQGSRLRLLRYLIGGQFLRCSWLHQLRIITALLFTQRYSSVEAIDANRSFTG